MDRTARAPDPEYDSLSYGLAKPQSLARTPSRRHQFIENELKPLLSDLSPSSTLEALASTDADSLGKRNHGQSFIQQSVASASASERAWGIKAALASKKLQEWHQELSGLSWGGYGVEQKNRPSEEEEYWGGIPAGTVKTYEERIEIIKDDMETLKVEDLKKYVRSTHGSRRSTFQGDVHRETSYDHLDEFTAVITATIVQALPTLSRLDLLLNTWSTRLLILRQVPAFLKDLADSQESMISAWIAVGKPDVSTAKRKSDSPRKAFSELQAILQDQISQLGRRLDMMLDLLEGSEDTLPGPWIDGMDDLEDEYSTWVVTAEELVSNDETDDGSTGISDAGLGKANGSEERVTLGTKLNTPLMDFDAQFDNIQQKVDNDFDMGLDRASASALHENATDKPFTAVSNQEKTNLSPTKGYEAQKSSRKPEQTFKTPPKTGYKPPALVLENQTKDDGTVTSEAESDISYPGSATSDYFSNRSSPEIRDASVVEYLGSPGLKSPTWSIPEPRTSLDVAGRRWSQHTERGEARSRIGFPPGLVSPGSQRSRASAFIPENGAAKDQDLSNGDWVDPYQPSGHVRTRSASMQSFEVVPKREIRQVLVRRSESYSSASTGLRHSETANSPLSPVPGSSGKETESTPPDVADNQLPMMLAHDSANKQAEPQDQDSEPSPPLIPPRSCHRFEQVSDLGPGSSPVKINKKTNSDPSEAIGAKTGTPTPAATALKSMDDQLEARISSILVNIPAHIRLTSGPGPDAPEVIPFNAISTPRTPAARRPSFRMIKAQTTPPPTMTLAPAQPKTSKQKSQNGEPEIKLYHLHQPGKDAPIKLFVRLVGETGERVMVRIGGGWADLGEYLKEYASHHGRRTASDTRFDIQSLQSSPLSSQVSPSSRPTTPSSSQDSIGQALKRGRTTPVQLDTPKTPVSDPLRPPSRSSTGWSGMDEDSPSLGLAGPKTKKFEISSSKQQWVDQMLDQARQGGAEKMGDLGKVGGTKRVFLKRRTEG